MNGYYSLERSDIDATLITPYDVEPLFDLARMYGFQDREARAEVSCAGNGVDDDMGKFTNDLAFRFADALNKALDDIPNHDARLHKLPSLAWGGADVAEVKSLSPLEYFSGEGDKDYLRELVAFCRRGGFSVVAEEL